MSDKINGNEKELDEYEQAAIIMGGLVEELKEKRGKLNYSQRELSLRSGIMQKTISRIESGKDLPKLSTLARLADAMGCKLEFEVKRRSEH